MEQVENSAEKKIRGKKKMHDIAQRDRAARRNGRRASSVRNGSEAENRPIPEHHRFLS